MNTENVAASAPVHQLVGCPFCGGEATLGYWGQPAVCAFGACTKCKARGPETSAGMTGSGAISDPSAFWTAAVVAWNGRASNSSVGQRDAAPTLLGGGDDGGGE
jgi:hypothetical protein